MKKLILSLAVLLFVAALRAQTVTKIQYDSLPLPVREHLLKKYNRYQVSDVQKSVSANTSVSYLVEARWQQKPNVVMVLNLVYNSIGILVESKKEKEVYYTGSEPVREIPHSSGDGHNH